MKRNKKSGLRASNQEGRVNYALGGGGLISRDMLWVLLSLAGIQNPGNTTGLALM